MSTLLINAGDFLSAWSIVLQINLRINTTMCTIIIHRLILSIDVHFP